MAEYTVVMAALVGGLLVANRGACPDQYEDCIEYLLTVMHDNYDGYSASIAAVHEYATDYEVSEGGGGGDDDGGGDDSGGGSTGGGDNGGEPTAAISQTTIVSSNGGFNNHGELDPSTGLVTNNGEVVGTYDDDTGTYEAADGSTTDAYLQDVVVDADGNVLQREAITDCGDPPQVYGFGYESKADGKFYDSLQFNEMDVDGYCTEAAYKMVDRDGGSDDGRIIDGHYYAFSTTPDTSIDTGVMEPDGEVVYFDLGGASFCAVMAAGWDSGIDEDLSDDEFYAAQMELLFEPNQDESTWIGSLDNEHYTEQVYINGEPSSPNDCPSNRVISEP
ncbi:hypothetical protein KO507_05845 [Gilvimarinus agarilyticus]|uniref:hypothetical protein n=1 Tax=Gilvimarinus sp. 2_MG-2023 TaxID=3062666 RepID=UPI001C088758|nr:hypothetical protein [Gilvimarinus sp. 2_MG-2023]MBU2885284.1 hypothetical protein [Gilvimarinus agarilyticus]MDO6570181.1 hypothetical protein [Gilvimarinus sp. 2_MG-2023]